jgi:hypothetical protein
MKSPPAAKKRKRTRRRMLVCFDVLVDTLRFLALTSAARLSGSSHAVYRAVLFNAPFKFATFHQRNITKNLSIISYNRVYDIKSGRLLDIPSVPLPHNIRHVFGKIRINFYAKSLTAFSPKIEQFLNYLAPHMTNHTLKIDMFSFYRCLTRPINKCTMVANKIVKLFKMFEKFGIIRLDTITPHALDRLFSTACFRNTTRIQFFHSLCHPYFDSVSSWLHIPNPLPRYFNTRFKSCNCTIHRPRACLCFMSHLARSFRHGDYRNAFYFVAMPTCTCFTLFIETYPFEKITYNRPESKCMVLTHEESFFYIITHPYPLSFIVRAPKQHPYATSALLKELAFPTIGNWGTCNLYYEFERQFASEGEGIFELGGIEMDINSKLLHLA